MKLNKKKVFTLALALCLIATISLGSLAWFTDTDSVTNDFFIAGSEDQNPDDIFSIDVWEDATEDDPTGEEKIQTGIKFEDILPGDELYKEVNVENTGSYPQYVRVTVTVTDADIWQAIFKETYVPLQEIVSNLNTNLLPWSTVSDQVANTLTYVFYYQQILGVDEVVTVFDEVKIPEALTREQAAKMAGGFQINVVADAVQTMNVGNSASEAFKTVGKEVRAGNYTIYRNTTLTVDNASSIITEDTIMENVTINSAQAGLNNIGAEVYLNNVTMNAGSAADYAGISREGSVTVYNDVNLTSKGGGVAAADGAQVTFNAGSVYVDTASTSGRYIFYAVGNGTVITINDGTFSWDKNDNQKRAYIYAEAGTTVYVNGGTFGAASTRSGYTAGILGPGTIVITGGTFGFDPTEWVADGYVATEANGVWTVSAAQ